MNVEVRRKRTYVKRSTVNPEQRQRKKPPPREAEEIKSVQEAQPAAETGQAREAVREPAPEEKREGAEAAAAEEAKQETAPAELAPVEPPPPETDAGRAAKAPAKTP